MNDLTLKRVKTSSKVDANKKKRVETPVQDSKMSENPDFPSILVELEDEIQRQLEEKAEKSNLTVRNVKNILQAVLTNEEVLKMVDEKPERSIYDLKLTRAKTKQLLGTDVPWQTPKKSVAEILNKDFPEDSSDEEYNPHYEVHSDEESKGDSILDETVEDVLESLNLNVENVGIGQRTRSKLCLSETPLEVIEQAFIPPDITPDMYNTDCDNQDWLNFLKEFTQPLETTVNENVDDDDPEYTFIMDEEQEAATDKEELRMDRAVKVTKKELNELMSELFEYTQMLSSDDEENPDVHKPQIQENQLTPVFMIPSVIVQPKKIIEQITPKQRLLIKQQVTQHIQLTLQHFIMSYNHPDLDKNISSNFKEMLLDFDTLKNSNKIFNTKNLDISLTLMKEWEEKKENMVITNKIGQKNPLPLEIMKFMANSTAFIYPFLLPTSHFSKKTVKQFRFTKFEDNLITMALFDIGETDGINYSEDEFEKICMIIHESVIPAKTPRLIFNHIRRIVNLNKSKNPIKDLLKHGQVLAVDHFISLIPKKLKTIYEHPKDVLPDNWVTFCESSIGSFK